MIPQMPVDSANKTPMAARGWHKARAITQWALILMLAGAVGNLVDRVRCGEVTDFVRFRLGSRSLFVNNLADDFVSIAAVLLLLGGFLPSARPPRLG